MEELYQNQTIAMNEKLEAIRQKCIEANPEIVELKFGCAVDRDSGEGVVEIIVSEAVGKISLMRRNKIGDWQPFQVPSELKQGWKIIGRPIRLADVLNAIRQSDKYVNVNKFGNFVAYDDAGLGATWNLFYDDLEQQSPETIEFISSVLGV